ncbi:MAG: glycoside hydrolase family protein [Rhodoferax sp.]|nr:glycoside hydrolase family protein [Rhodoferax sp.]
MADPNRSLIAVLVLTASGLVGIAVDEYYTSNAIPDPAKGIAVPTIGFGTTGRDVHMGDTTTPTKALARLLSDVQRFEAGLRYCIKVPLHQYEYNAFVNLAYNIGLGKSGVKDGFCYARRGGLSTIATRLNAMDYVGACNAILDWRMVGDVDCSAPENKSCSGLWKRRLRLQKQCLGLDAMQATQ